MPALTHGVTKPHSLIFYTYNPPTIKSKQSLFAMRVLQECVFGSLIKVQESPQVQKINIPKKVHHITLGQQYGSNFSVISYFFNNQAKLCSKVKTPVNTRVFRLRRGWDSNPRRGYPPYSLSRGAPSENQAEDAQIEQRFCHDTQRSTHGFII